MLKSTKQKELQLQWTVNSAGADKILKTKFEKKTVTTNRTDWISVVQTNGIIANKTGAFQQAITIPPTNLVGTHLNSDSTQFEP
jgi:hypothetical protein